MADYKEMYRKLFQATTKAIDILQEAQRETEALYISSDQTGLRLLQEEPLKSDDDEQSSQDHARCAHPQ